MPNENPNTPTPEARPALIALNMGLPEHGIVPAGRALDDIVKAIESPGCNVLWLRGPEGCGRSTLTYNAIGQLAEQTADLVGTLRVQCWPGLRVEQALWTVGEFFEQLGISELYRVLHQRTTLASKLRLLLQILHDHKVWLWFDDFQNLTGPYSDPASAILKDFVESAQEFGQFEGRIILVTEKDGPDGLEPSNSSHVTLLDLDPNQIVNTREVWKVLAEEIESESPDGETPPDFDSIPEAIRDNPLALRLYLRQARIPDRGLAPDSPAAAAANSLNALMVQMRQNLDPEARRTLDMIALHVRPIGRGTLRALLQSTQEDSEKGQDQDSDKEGASSERYVLAGVETLRCRGIVQGNRADNRIHVHPAIRKTAARRIHSEDRLEWAKYHEAIAEHLSNTARRARSVWDHYWAFRHLTRCGKSKKAYESQKTFIEFFMGAGYLDLARGVLEILLDRVQSPFREVVIGNLAIVLKNEGQFDRAIELYERSLKAFVDRNDLVNAARVYHQIGNTHYAQADHKRALENYRQSFEIAKQAKDAMVCLMASVQIGNVHFSTGEHSTALVIYSEALNEATEMNHRKIMTALHTQIAQIHLIQKRMTDAEACLSSAEAIAMEDEDLRQILKVLQVRGVVASEGRRTDDALHHVRRAGKIASSLGDSIEYTNCLLQEGEMEEGRQKYGAAARCFIDARSVLVHSIDTSPGDEEKNVFRQALASIDGRIQTFRDNVGEEAFERILRKPDSGSETNEPVSRATSQKEE
jgi:tetratricopeptide (TPR) repeat protein